MKKSILALSAVLISSVVLSASDISVSDKNTSVKEMYLDISSGEGKELFKSEIAYNNYLRRESLQNGEIERNKLISEKNACDIAMLKKAVAKLINTGAIKNKDMYLKDINSTSVKKDKDNMKKDIIENIKSNEFKTIEESKIAKQKNCRTETSEELDTSKISKSFFKFDKLKQFKVTYNVAGEFDKPVLGISRNKLLLKGAQFKADMFTKAGWVHNINGGWVKGYKLYPRVLNHTTKEDIKKWKSKYKKVTKVICDKK